MYVYSLGEYFTVARYVQCGGVVVGVGCGHLSLWLPWSGSECACGPPPILLPLMLRGRDTWRLSPLAALCISDV